MGIVGHLQPPDQMLYTPSLGPAQQHKFYLSVNDAKFPHYTMSSWVFQAQQRLSYVLWGLTFLEISATPRALIPRQCVWPLWTCLDSPTVSPASLFQLLFLCTEEHLKLALNGAPLSWSSLPPLATNPITELAIDGDVLLYGILCWPVQPACFQQIYWSRKLTLLLLPAFLELRMAGDELQIRTCLSIPSCHRFTATRQLALREKARLEHLSAFHRRKYLVLGSHILPSAFWTGAVPRGLCLYHVCIYALPSGCFERTSRYVSIVEHCGGNVWGGKHAWLATPRFFECVCHMVFVFCMH